MDCEKQYRCEECGTAFGGHKRRFCAEGCRVRSQRRRAAEKQLAGPPTAPRECAFCATTFAPVSTASVSKTCSPECRTLAGKSAYRNATIEERRAELAARKSGCVQGKYARTEMQLKIRGSVCQHCERTYLPKSAERVTFCSRECSIAAKVASAKPKPVAPDKYCEVCRTNITGIRAAKFCSVKCQKKGAAAKSLERYYSERQLQVIPFKCLVCGKCGTGQSKRRYCSKRCSVKAGKKKRRLQERICERQRQQRIAAGDRINPYEIFARDGWVCQLCHRPVNRDAPDCSPDAPTLDHIVPLSKEGEHTAINVQCAHFACNSKRGNRGPAQQRLFG